MTVSFILLEMNWGGVLEETLPDLDEVLDELWIFHPVGPWLSCFYV